jgi:signal transduction histidine kinase
MKKRRKKMKEHSNGTFPGADSDEHLFSLIAHDLKTTFNAVINISRHVIIGFDTMEPGEIKDCVNIIYKSSSSMNQSLENFIIGSRLKEVRSSKQGGTIVNGLITGIAGDMALMYKSGFNKDIGIIFTAQENIHVNMDELMLTAVIKNLLSNAFKFSPADGTIGINASAKDGMANISIRDDGEGMTGNDIDNFNGRIPFSKPGTSGEKGSGLGLILCRNILELHGGRLHVESKTGGGCVFIAEMPQASPMS